MHDPQATGRILITELPHGEAPEWVRKAWVGLTLPCYPVAGRVSDAGGVVTGNPDASKWNSGYIVPVPDALAVLEKENPDAVAYWRATGYPKPGVQFFFKHREAMALTGVQNQRLMVADDMETGRMELPGR